MKRKTLPGLAFLALTFFGVQPQTVLGQGILYYPAANGSVLGVDVGIGTVVKTVSATAFVGANPGAGRNVAFDPVTRLMWYSATDGQMYSVHADTLEAGPSVTGVGGANPGAGRHLFIDYKRRTIWTPLTDGSIAIYDLATQAEAGSIPANFFTDGNVGGLRHFASDQRSGLMWYAATDGSFIEMNPDTVTRTGRVIPFSVQTGADPGAFRHFVIDPVRDLLLYAVTDGSVASINLTTLTAGSLLIPSASLSGGTTGAGRTLTYDIQPLDFIGSFEAPTRLFSLGWRPFGTGYMYTVLFRTNVAEGEWLPVPPVEQWPKSEASLTGIETTSPRIFYRLLVHPPGHQH